MRKPAIIALLLCVLVPLSASASNRHRHHTAVQSSREIIVASSTIRTPAPLPPALVTTATPVPTVELAALVALTVGPTKVVQTQTKLETGL